MGNIVVPVDGRLYSTLKIGVDAFPFMFFHDDLSSSVRSFVNWHLRKEIEISFHQGCYCILHSSISELREHLVWIYRLESAEDGRLALKSNVDCKII